MSQLDLKLYELNELQLLFARGYTIRYINNWLTARAATMGRADLIPNEQQLLTFAVRYAPDIEEYRQQLAKDTMTRGLARKEERISRLSEMAESVEDQAMTGMNLKASEMYRRTIKDIANETEGLNIKLQLPDDPWAKLLLSLKEKADSRGSSQTSLPSPTTSLSESGPTKEKSTPSATTSPNTDTPTPTTDNERSSINEDA